jgi:hypothetical protein
VSLAISRKARPEILIFHATGYHQFFLHASMLTYSTGWLLLPHLLRIIPCSSPLVKGKGP